MGRLHDETLTDDHNQFLKAHQQVAQGRFYLAGGTALALHLGHRRSRDLDYFTDNDFDTAELRDALRAIVPAPHEIVESQNTLRAYYQDPERPFETSWIKYPGPAKTQRVRIGESEVELASLEQLAVMKASALASRGQKRDFIDIYALTQEEGWDLERICALSEEAGLDRSIFKRAIRYFDDAEIDDEMPAKCVYRWEEVRQGILDQAEAWERGRPPQGPSRRAEG